MSDLTINLKMKPWSVPGYAVVDMPPQPKQMGATALPTILLANLPLEALDSLVEQWRVEVYEKAGKPLPELRGK